MKQNGKYYIPVARELVEVSKEFYYDYYRPIWKICKRAKRAGECRCPRNQLSLCDGCCLGCDYYTPRDIVYLDTPIGSDDGDLTIGNTLSSTIAIPESILINIELLVAIHNELDRLSPDDKFICDCFLATGSERQAAALADMARTTYQRRWARIKAELREKLKDYYL